MSNVIITGGSSGIGLHIAMELTRTGHEVWNLDQVTPDNYDQLGFHTDICGVNSLAEIRHSAGNIHSPDIVINCAGVNFIDWIEQTPDEEWDRIMNTNAKGIFNTTKVFMKDLVERKGTIVNIVSNASHMPMTNSIAYNASKGAAHIMTLQIARELGPKGITVFGISPNKVSGTGMSKYIDGRVCALRGWTEEYAREYQLAGLPAGEETDPNTLAEFVGFLLATKQRHKYLAGTILPYGK